MAPSMLGKHGCTVRGTELSIYASCKGVAGHEVVASSPLRSKILFSIVLRNNLNDQDHLEPFPPQFLGMDGGISLACMLHPPSPLASIADTTNQSQHIFLLGPGDQLPNPSQHRALGRPC